MKKMTLLLAFFCLSLGSSYAETIYLNSTGGCLDRLEYLVTNNNQTNNHTVYRFSPQENTNLILDVGTTGTNLLDRLPANLTSCSTVQTWNENTVRRINSQELVVFVVQQTAQGYNLSKVNSSSWSKKVGQTVTYFNSDFDFTADLSYINYDQPISSASSKSEVILENYSLYDCSTVLTLRQSPNSSSIPNGSYQFIPEFGITAYAEGWDVNKSKNKMQLTTVNGRDYNAVLSDDCKRRGLGTSYVGTLNEGRNTGRIISGSDYIPQNAIYTGHIDFNEPVIQEEYVAPTPVAYAAQPTRIVEPVRDVVIIEEKKEAPQEVFVAREIPVSYDTYVAPNPCGASTEHGYHLVQKGETLYALVRKYNVPLAQIKTWNGLKEDLIKPCMSLRVAKDAAPNPAVVVAQPAPKAAPAPIKKEVEIVYVPVEVIQEVPAKEEFTSKSAVNHSDMSWLNKSEIHIVAQGETIENIANSYGYTEERFRYINGMRDDQTLRIGQQLRTTDCNCVVTPQPYEATDSRIFTEKGLTAKEVPTSYEAVAAKEIPASYEAVSYRKIPVIKNSSKTLYRVVPETDVVSVSPDAVSVAPNGHTVHIVRKEDTLYSLAKEYNTSIEVIMALNNLDKGEIIIPAQRLYVK